AAQVDVRKAKRPLRIDELIRDVASRWPGHEWLARGRPWASVVRIKDPGGVGGIEAVLLRHIASSHYLRLWIKQPAPMSNHVVVCPKIPDVSSNCVRTCIPDRDVRVVRRV